MMRKYLKESLHWIHLALFKPITLGAEARSLGEWQTLGRYLKVLPVQLALVLTIVFFFGALSKLAKYPFDLAEALTVAPLAGLFFGLFIGFWGGVIGRVLRVWRAWRTEPGFLKGLVIARVSANREAVIPVGDALLGGLICGVGGGLIVGLEGGRLEGPGGCYLLALSTATVVGVSVRRIGAWLFGLIVGLLGGLTFYLLSLLLNLTSGGLGGLFPVNGLTGEFDNRVFALQFGTAYAVVFLILYLRPFLLPPYLVQLRRSKKAADPFPFFRNSPVYWDEAIAMPFPSLTDWLIELAKFDGPRGMSEFMNVARLPHQRRAAQRALLALLVTDLQQTDSLKKMASAPEILAILPAHVEQLLKGLEEVARRVLRVADLASEYQTRVTPVGQMNVLAELRIAAESFYESLFNVMTLAPVGPAVGIKTLRWLEVVKAEEVLVRERMAFEPIPNPFVVGNPLMVRDKNLFKGRKDIIVAIEENIINPAQRPALLLYGRRRIGKTSTLLNLPRLLSSKFVPVFIDCQDAKWREGDEAFCYHLAASIHDALNQRALAEPSSRPQLERFERYAFTRLGEYLDQIEESTRAAQKQILLTFDEYEKLEQGINASKITTEVLNQLRTIVQHREQIVVLFSGGHRFEEMTTINWSDYLINVKTLELSFLAPEDARELITEPVPLLQYESGLIEQIIEMTHCQPYLLQAVASDLVNYLNSDKRMLATAADLEVAVEKVLVTAQAYFFYNWTEDCTEPEREVLRMIATGDTNSRTLAERQANLQSLCHKEILERQASGYRFSIELFRRWVLKNQTSQAPGDLFAAVELVGAPHS